MPIVGPVILGSIAEVEERTMALEARGFTRPGRRTLLWSPPDSARAGPRCAGRCVVGLVAVVAARLAGVARMTIALAGVGYRYAGAARPALLDIDLELRDGEVVGLVGASEAGKTTLCLVRQRTRAADGRRPASGAAITLDGEDVDAWPMHRLSQRIGIGFQNPATQLSQVTDTVFEEVAFGPMNLALPRDEVVERTWAALESLRHRRPGRARPGAPVRRPAAAGGASPGCWPCARRTSSSTSRPRSSIPAGTRLVADAIERLAGEGASILVAEQKTDLLARGLLAGRRASTTDAWSRSGPAADVLADPRLGDLGCRGAVGASGCGARREAAGVSGGTRMSEALAGG